MGISRQLFLLVCVIWCSLDRGHSIPTDIKAVFKFYSESLTFTSQEVKPPLEENFNECGKSRKIEDISLHKLSIFGGKKAKLGDWPWMVALFFGSPSGPEKHFFCGGSLISNRWIITAAHCVEDVTAEKIFARLGDLSLDNQINDGASPIDALVDHISPHPQFSKSPLLNDIALIRLTDSVHFTENIRPICLLSGPIYESDQYYHGKHPFIVGWENKDKSEMLLEASVPIVKLEECAEKYSKLNSTRKNIWINGTVICAGGFERGTCQTDNGGPLIFYRETEKRFYLGGVISDSPDCNSYKYPTRFTKIAQYINWINEVTD